MSNQEPDPNDPAVMRYHDAMAFAKGMSQQQRESWALPTRKQLEEVLEGGSVVVKHKEWTREGYIYDPETGTFDTEPGEDAQAGLRFVKNGPSPEDVLSTVPEDVRAALMAENLQALSAALEKLPPKEAQAILENLEASGIISTGE